MHGETRATLSDERWYRRLLDAITAAQAQQLGRVRAQPLFEDLLAALLDLTDSEYGFIGEVLRSESGAPYLRNHAVTNIAWDAATRRFFDESAPNGLEFRNLGTLFGAALTTEAPVISNAPATDPRRGGLPRGHPPLRAFLGIPLRSGGEMVGMIGVANRPGGYDENLLEDMGPFLQTCANAIYRLRADLARRRAEEQLRDEEQRLRAILDAAFEAIITIDESGIIESFNRHAEQIFGYSAAEICGDNIALLMPDSYRTQHDVFIQRYRATGIGRILGVAREIYGRRRDGTEFPIELTVRELSVGGRRLFTGLIRDLSERDAAEKQLKSLEIELERSRFGQMIGGSSAMRRLYQTIDDVARGDWTVLVEGETGVGKELVARAIHAASANRSGSFVAVNCAGLTESLLDSQLFGHRRGAFSGAVRDQEGFFEAADGGTIFLDEIGDISQGAQTSLLRVLQEGEIVRIGDTKPKKIHVRVIAATNRDLSSEVSAGRFRTDLFYRLRVARAVVPPLRERRDDIRLLAEAFLAEARITTPKTIGGFAPSAMKLLRDYSWPGNVRELRSAVDYAVMHCKNDSICARDLPPEILGSGARDPAAKEPDRLDTEDTLRGRILDTLDRSGGNRTRAAELLGISRATLYRRLKALNLDRAG
jgi:PAS domain S-box-containing protein